MSGGIETTREQLYELVWKKPLHAAAAGFPMPRDQGRRPPRRVMRSVFAAPLLTKAGGITYTVATASNDDTRQPGNES